MAEFGRSGDTGSLDALLAHLDANPMPGRLNLYLFLVLDLKELFFEHFPQQVADSSRWGYLMRIVWLPGYRDYVEDQRFFEIMNEAGTVALWEQRGYPDGCVRVNDPAGDHLDCTSRYR